MKSNVVAPTAKQIGRCFIDKRNTQNARPLINAQKYISTAGGHKTVLASCVASTYCASSSLNISEK